MRHGATHGYEASSKDGRKEGRQKGPQGAREENGEEGVCQEGDKEGRQKGCKEEKEAYASTIEAHGMSKKTAKKRRHANAALDEQQKIEQIITDVTEERRAASSQVSTQSRAIALGVLAVAWLLLSDTRDGIGARFVPATDALIAVAAICVLALALDLFQYVLTLWETSGALTDSHAATRLEDAGYDDPSWLRRFSLLFYGAKLLASCGAAACLLIVIYRVLRGGG